VGDNIDEIIGWLSSANMEKNNGFYVNLKVDRWVLPTELDEWRFVRERSYVESIISYVEKFLPLLDMYITEIKSGLANPTNSK
jgi:hypothetical protein